MALSVSNVQKCLTYTVGVSEASQHHHVLVHNGADCEELTSEHYCRESSSNTSAIRNYCIQTYTDMKRGSRQCRFDIME